MIFFTSAGIVVLSILGSLGIDRALYGSWLWQPKKRKSP